MDPLVAIESTMAVVETISEIYWRKQHLRVLPDGFHKLCRGLPRAQNALHRMGQQLQGLALDGSSAKALRPLVILCEKQAKRLLVMFEEYDESLPDLYGALSQHSFGLADRIEAPMEDFLRCLYELSNLCCDQLQSNENHKSRIDILRALYTSPYVDRKNSNPDRVLGTCEWFVGHHDFQRWRESTSSSMLWVSANPGTGKSVLAKYLVDSELQSTVSRTTCYFFFKDEFDDQRRAKSALSCILHQLFTQRQDLFSDETVKLLKAYKADIASSFDKLWEVLLMVSQNNYAGELVCILDAFDECEDQERLKLAQALRKYYDMKNDTKDNANLKFLVTSRPYNKIRRDFQRLDSPGLPVIHLKGESDSETSKIAQEIDVFIEDRVSRMRKNLLLQPAEEQILLQGLRRHPNQTYLWVHFTLESIERDRYFRKNLIHEAASSLPRPVVNAYEKLLSKIKNVKEVKKILHIIVAAARPLTLAELHLALAIRQKTKCYKDLDFMPEAHFRNYVTDLCGLFVTVKNSKIYLLHQTAREFLVRKGDPDPRGYHDNRLIWKSSLRPPESHRILCHICIWHLLFAEFQTLPLGENPDKSPNAFLDYSAINWAAHFRASDIEEDAVIESLLLICDPSSSCFQTWFSIYCASAQMDFPQGFTRLMVASYFGLEQCATLLLRMNGIEVDARDDTYQRSALSWASENGFDGIVKLLIEGPRIRSKNITKQSSTKGAKINIKDRYGLTPLSYAALAGHMAVVERLVKAGASVDSKDEIGGTPVSYALCCGQKAVAERLMKRVPVVSVGFRQESLILAAKKGHKPIIKLLLRNGADIEAMDSAGRTPLSWAAGRGHEATVKLLVDRGAIIEATDSTGRTPLSYAAEGSHVAVAQLLLDTGAINKTIDSINVAKNAHEAIVQLLVATSKLDHHGQGSLLNPGCSDSSHTTEMSSKPDSGYASLESRGPSTKHDIDNASLYSVGSIVPRGLQETYVDEFSQQLSNELRKLLMVEELPGGFCGVLLPELLKSFSRRLHGESTKRAQREASVFVHRHRRDIVKFVAQTFPGDSHSQVSDNDIFEKETGTSGARVTEIEGSPDDVDYEEIVPSREPFKKDAHEITHWVSSLDSRTSSEPLNAVGDVDSQTQSRDSPLPQIGDYRSFIETSRAYRWLLSSLRKHLQLDMPDPNLMYEIGEFIRRKLLEDDTMRKLSRRQAQPSVKMAFELKWDLRKFVIDQEYVKSGTSILERILCVTGTRRCAQATTVHDYFEQTWPGVCHPLISLLNKFLSSTQSTSCDFELPDGTSLTITQDQSQCFIVVMGGFEFVAEIGEQLGWLASALRPSELPEGVLSCVPQISSIDLHGQSTHKGNITINATCRIRFSMNRIDDSNPLLPGFCWANMFRNPVIVAGYPIRHRDQGDTGLEIPLEAMAELVQSSQVFSIDGNIMLKGFCSLLVVTAIIADTAMWHFLFNADGERISYCDTRLEGLEGVRIVTYKGLELKDLETRRHVVGWCSSVREFTGHPRAGFGVKRSILPHFPTSVVIDRLYVESGFHVIGGISVSPGKRDKPLRLAKARGNLAKLEWIYSQALVLMDVDDRRAWLVDGASGLLHLVRASIEQNRNHPAYKSKWKFSGALKLEGDDFLGLGGDHGATAVEILGNTENLNVQLYVDDVRPNASGQLVEVPYYLRDKVQEVLPHLEALIDKQAEVAAQDGYWIRSPSKLLEKSLAGWDFWDIAGPAGPVQRRIYHLQASGHGWVDYIRSIKAVTIFGRGFGELLEPEKQKLCPNWMTVPKNKDYLGTSIATLKHIDASSNTQLVDQGSITADIKWLSQATLFSPCACLDPDGAKPSHHHNPVQLLLPKGLNLHLDIPNTCLSITIGSIERNGAVVFGHTPYRRPWPKSKNTDDQADSESTEPPSSASNSTQPRAGHSDESGLFEMSSSSSRAQPTSASRPVTLKNPAKVKVKGKWSWLKKLSR